MGRVPSGSATLSTAFATQPERLEKTANLDLSFCEASFTRPQKHARAYEDGTQRELPQSAFSSCWRAAFSAEARGLRMYHLFDSTSIMELDAVPEQFARARRRLRGPGIRVNFRRLGSQVTVVPSPRHIVSPRRPCSRTSSSILTGRDGSAAE